MIGRYEIIGELGRGGMATVFRGFDPRFKREVAIKVLPREFLHDPTFRARFEREAQTIAALEHPAIVPVYDFGEEDGQPFIVMRLMTGGSLADRLTRGPLPIAEAARLYERLSSALDEAHARGVIHRDLKPGNILFDARQDPYLSDFGIAKLTEASAAFTGSAVIGTPAYMSPEQAKGERNIDGRSDVYALGAILFEMLTGQTPYEADTPMGVVVKHIVEPVPRILAVNPSLPGACETIIATAMAKEREARFQTAAEMARALRDTSEGRPAEPPVAASTATVPASTVAPPAATPTVSGPAPGAAPASWPAWLLPAGGGLLGIAALALLGVWLWNGGASPAASPTPAPTTAVAAAVRTNTAAPTQAQAIATAPPEPTTASEPTKAPEPTQASTKAPEPTQAPTLTSPPRPTLAPSPTLAPPTPTAGLSARITGITLSNDTYVVAFNTGGYQPAPGDRHVHFFFNTVSEGQAGLPGGGPWIMYDGGSPFTQYTASQRGAATALCILVANPDHSIQPGTGNCVGLP